MRRRFFFLTALALLIIAATSYYLLQSPKASPPRVASKSQPAAFNKKQYSLTDPSSPWIIVNKHRPLQPKDYAPRDLVTPSIALRTDGMQVRQVTATALQTMFAAATHDQIGLKLSSGYRSYAYQVNLYAGYVQKQGQAGADSLSARPGYSEHQTGWAADISAANGSCTLQQCFATTPAGKWLAANAYKYGFIIRYGAGQQSVTGYASEPWHVRYVGLPLAAQIHSQGNTTLEQFFKLDPAPDYQ